MWSDAELRAMSRSERARLARALSALDGPHRLTLLSGPGRVAFVGCVLGCAAALAAWIGLLAATLPAAHVTRQWRLAWVGFDLALLAGLAVTGWAAWRRRPTVVPAALVTATLLCADAWFDVLLSWGGRDAWQSLASALAVELPLAGLLFGVARQMLRGAAPAAGADPDPRRPVRTAGCRHPGRVRPGPGRLDKW